MRIIYPLHIISLTGLVLAIVAGASRPARAGQEGWTVAKISGHAWRGEGADRVEVVTGMTIPPGVTISTAERTRVMLGRGSESMVIGPRSELSISEQPGQGLATTILEKAGSASFDVEKHNVQHFSVETPMLAAVVKGTHFTVSARRGISDVSVDRGTVQVTSLGTHETSDVTIGQKAHVDARGLSVSGTGVHSPAFRTETPTSPAEAPSRSVTTDNNSAQEGTRLSSDHAPSLSAISRAMPQAFGTSAEESASAAASLAATAATQATIAAPSAGVAPGPAQSRSRKPNPTGPGASGAGTSTLSAALRGSFDSASAASVALSPSLAPARTVSSAARSIGSISTAGRQQHASNGGSEVSGGPGRMSRSPSSRAAGDVSSSSRATAGVMASRAGSGAIASASTQGNAPSHVGRTPSRSGGAEGSGVVGLGGENAALGSAGLDGSGSRGGKQRGGGAADGTSVAGGPAADGRSVAGPTASALGGHADAPGSGGQGGSGIQGGAQRGGTSSSSSASSGANGSTGGGQGGGSTASGLGGHAAAPGGGGHGQSGGQNNSSHGR